LSADIKQEEWQHLAELIHRLPPEEQQNIQRMITQFTHDLRQNMGNIITAEVLLQRSLAEDASQKELLDIIHSSTQKAVGLITDMARPFDDEITIPSHRP